jgi:hypothetical protein
MVRSRASISACGPLSGGLLPTRGTPRRHDQASGCSPQIAAIPRLEGPLFGAVRGRFGCPTGQAEESTESGHCLLPQPLTHKFHSELYGHETLSGFGEAYSRPGAGTMPETKGKGKFLELLRARWDLGPRIDREHRPEPARVERQGQRLRFFARIGSRHALPTHEISEVLPPAERNRIGKASGGAR